MPRNISGPLPRGRGFRTWRTTTLLIATIPRKMNNLNTVDVGVANPELEDGLPEAPTACSCASRSPKRDSDNVSVQVYAHACDSERSARYSDVVNVRLRYVLVQGQVARA